MITYLLGKSSTGKFRFTEICWDEEWKEPEHGFLITRKYGQVGGKVTSAPEIWIKEGKVGRTHKEQTILQFNHLVKEYTDKAYKIVDKHPNEYSLEELQEIYGDVKMRGDTVKPMLAKQESAVTNRKIFEDRDWYGSRKINGVRTLIFFDGKIVRTASRGAMNYDIALNHILHHPLLEKFFKMHPDAILDGEAYEHHKSLNYISGICRSQQSAYDGKDLEFYWYDIADLSQPFSERYETMREWSKELQLSDFDPERHLSDDQLHIQFLPHILIKGFDNMKKLHDEYVSEGWEGLVIRQAKSLYKPGTRNNDWIKIKEYLDETFKVIGYELGLRGSEDMTFICEMQDGRTFKAMPIGDRNIKIEYIENFESKYKNQLGDCKYFELSPYGIPQQPKFIAFRYDLNFPSKQ